MFAQKSISNCNYKFTESVEHCCSITSLQLGDSIQNIAKDMDTHSYKTPLGVVGGK